MSEGNFLSEIFSDRPASKTPKLEGAIVTGRSWIEYQSMLGVKPEALKNETVLNFGSGASNIGRDLKTKGVDCSVIDLDLKYDPWENSENPFRLFAAIPVHLYLKYFNPNEQTRQKLVNLKRKIAGTEGRNFVQGNGRALPFPDEAFDHVLGLWSTYQIPPEAKESVYRELMRVGKTLHLGPIFKNDYDLLSKLAAEQDFEVVACQPIPLLKDVPFMFSSVEDYSRYMNQKDQEERISIPKRADSSVNTMLGMKSAGRKGGNTIILRRKSL
ncbi:class I SAM-dependent methyltransferase [Patescibacteria group bacterium]|nr:class I SAM-dependent methyltransferase [Patescibacteria group bacterium]